MLLRAAGEGAPIAKRRLGYERDDLSRAQDRELCGKLPSDAIARHNWRMDLTPRLNLMNWLVSQGLTGLPENEVLRGFCERCRAEGLDLSRGLVFIDTLHPIYEGRGFRWNDVQSNEGDSFEYGSTSDGDAAKNWRRSTFLSHARTRP